MKIKYCFIFGLLVGAHAWAQESARPKFETEAEIQAEVERLKAEPVPVTTNKSACGKTGIPAALFAPSSEAKSLSNAAEDELFVLMEELGQWEILGTEIMTINLDAIVPPDAIGQYSKVGDWCTAPVLEVAAFGYDPVKFELTNSWTIDDKYFSWRGVLSEAPGYGLSIRVDQYGKAEGTYRANGVLFFFRQLTEDQYLLINVGRELRPPSKIRNPDGLQEDIEGISQPAKKQVLKDSKETATRRTHTATALVIGLNEPPGFLMGLFNDARDEFLDALSATNVTGVSVSGTGFHNIRHIDSENTPIELLARVVFKDEVIRALYNDSGADFILFYASTGTNDINGIADIFRTRGLPLVAGVNLDTFSFSSTAAHEIGHIFGAGHETITSGLFPDSSAIRTGGVETLMYSVRSPAQINQYSSDDKGLIGDDDHDNARVFMATAETLSRLGRRVSQTVAPPVGVQLIATSCVPNQYVTYFATWSNPTTPFTHYETAFSRTTSFTSPFDVGVDNADKFNLPGGFWNIAVRSRLGNRISQWIIRTIFVDTSCGSIERKPEG